MYWSPNFLAVVFKKQEISQQVVIRMQDLTSGFSQIFRGSYPRTLTAKGGGDPLPHRTPRPAFGQMWGASAPVRCWDPNLGPPQLFSRGCAPARVCEQFCVCSGWNDADWNTRPVDGQCS